MNFLKISTKHKKREIGESEEHKKHNTYRKQIAKWDKKVLY